jgi:methionyl-tRNA formyltransferase
MVKKKHENIRIVFVGCHQEGKECLQEILKLGGHVVGLFTFTDELAQQTSGAVSFLDISEKYSIPLYKVKTTNSPESVELFKKLAPDIIFVIGWTRLISKQILEIPKYGCVGMHASLLPKYRGRAPVNWVLINNESESGNTALLLDEGVDTGKMITQRRYPLTLADTCQTVYHKVAEAGRSMLQEIMHVLAREQRLPQKSQPDEHASEMPKRRPEDGVIDWQKSSLELFNWVRALTHPYPGAFTYFNNRRLFIWEARIAHMPAVSADEYQKLMTKQAGVIVSITDGIAVLTGNKELLTLHRLNFEDQPDMSWSQFLEYNTLKVDDRLG